MRLVVALSLSVAACADHHDDQMMTPDAPSSSMTDAPPSMPVVPPACTTDRTTTDRPDDTDADQVHVLYVLPSDGVDRGYDTSGAICNSVRAFSMWFQAQSGGRTVRFDTQGGTLDIGFVRLTETDAQLRGTDPNNTSIDTGTAFVRERIERELVAMGKIASNKLYEVYYDGSSVYACGAGAWPPVIEARVAAMYLRATPPGVTGTCGDVRPWGQASLVPNYIDYAMLHETVHTLGFVPTSAPHQQSSGHVYDGTADSARDLMYTPRPNTSDPGWNIDAGLILDINHDDYFMDAPALDLARSSLVVPDGSVRPIGW